ncbi:MAG: cyclase family protein [Ignavibacteriales bacterium]|nr:cyclase family protein [Ignavibacteriales bacterium]
MNKFSVLVFSLLLLSCAREKPDPFAGTIVDLSYAYDSTTIYWPTEKGFVFEKGPEGMTPAGFFYTANRFWTPEHGGTHLDAPIHFYKDRNTVDQIPVDQLIGNGVVIDVSAKCSADRDYRVQVEDFEAWEKEHGKIPDGSIVLLRTGFGKFWPDRERYMGTNERGQEAVAKLHFPGLHPDAAKWVTTSRKIKAIGLDTPSIDYGQSSRFESHVTLFEANIPALENVANLEQLPDQGFTVIALPVKIKGGSGGPVRIAAVVN